MTAPTQSPTTTREQAIHAALIAKARATNSEQTYIGVSPGGFTVMLARPNGSGGAAHVRHHAETWLYAGYIRDALDNARPDQRGPAADKQSNGDAR